MSRFLTLALPLLIVVIALFNLGVELVGLDPELGPLVGWREGRTGLPGAYVLGSWALEALGLTALYVLIASPARPRWMSGLLTGWIAWVFRGPLLVLAAVAVAGQAGGPWWRLSLRWLLLYTAAGLLLAALAALTRYGGEGAPGDPDAVDAQPEAGPALPLHDTAPGDALGLAFDAGRGDAGPSALDTGGPRGEAIPDEPDGPDDPPDPQHDDPREDAAGETDDERPNP